MARRPVAIVDAHHHLWQLGRFPYRWLAPDAAPRPFGDHSALKRNYLVDDYRRDAGSLPIVSTVHVQANCGADDPLDETRWLDRLADVHGLPDAIVAEADLCAAAIGVELRAQARHRRVKGVRALVAWDVDGHIRFADRPGMLSEAGFRRGVDALAELDLALDLVVVPSQLTEVARLAASRPSVRIVVNHLAALQPGRPGQLAIWRSGLRELADHENVSMKLSGLWTIHRDWSADALRPHVRHAFELFGAERLMYGSNLPIESLMCSMERQVDTLTTLVDELDPRALGSVFHDTAARVYRLQDRSVARRLPGRAP